MKEPILSLYSVGSEVGEVASRERLSVIIVGSDVGATTAANLVCLFAKNGAGTGE
jgi:hypothetical protein